jgi:flagellin-like protein
MKKGISPVIATVIIVAVALVLAVALAGWSMGIWSTLGSTEALYITGSISKVGTTVYVNVTIYNKGTAPANITKVEMYDNAGTLLTNTTGVTVDPGASKDYNYNMSSGTVGVGRTYTVKFYTASGNVYTVPMQCVRA